MSYYQLFPNEKDAEFQRECEKDLENLGENVRQMNRDAKAQEKGKRSAGLRGFGIFSTLILIIVPLYSCSSFCGARREGNWSHDFPVYVEGLIVMVITGLVVGLILSRIERLMNKAKQKEIDALKEKTEYGVMEEKSKRTGIENTYREKSMAYRREFYEESDRRSPKFAGNPVTDEIVNWLSGFFVNQIRAIPRESPVMPLQTFMQFQVCEDKVMTSFGSYLFADHRVDSLGDAADAMALAKAIGTGLQAEVLARFPKDPIGTPARVHSAYTDDGHMALTRVTYSSEKEV